MKHVPAIIHGEPALDWFDRRRWLWPGPVRDAFNPNEARGPFVFLAEYDGPCEATCAPEVIEDE